MVALRSENSGRMNVLLTDRGQHWAVQLPQLLRPMGVRAMRADCVSDAARVLEKEKIDVAVVDMSLPLEPYEEYDPTLGVRCAGGLKLLRLIQRLDNRPPAVVVVRGKKFDRRVDDYLLSEALKFDAFSVLDVPVELEQLLEVMRRALERYFGGGWPGK